MVRKSKRQIDIDKNLYLSFVEKSTREELISLMELLVSRETVSNNSYETPLDDLIKEVDAIAAACADLEKRTATTGACIRPMLRRMSQRSFTETCELMNDIIEKNIFDCPCNKMKHIVDFKNKLNEHALVDYVDIVDSIADIISQ